jgi:hypothetical protein
VPHRVEVDAERGKRRDQVNEVDHLVKVFAHDHVHHDLSDPLPTAAHRREPSDIRHDLLEGIHSANSTIQLGRCRVDRALQFQFVQRRSRRDLSSSSTLALVMIVTAIECSASSASTRSSSG